MLLFAGYGKSNMGFVEGLEKMHITEKRYNTESVYGMDIHVVYGVGFSPVRCAGEALAKFADTERNITTHFVQFVRVPQVA